MLGLGIGLGSGLGLGIGLGMGLGIGCWDSASWAGTDRTVTLLHAERLLLFVCGKAAAGDLSACV